MERPVKWFDDFFGINIDSKYAVSLKGTGDVKISDGAGAVYENNIGDITASENQVYSVYVSARSGTNSERSAMAVIEGYRTGFN